jgi:hypothetical protein
MEFRREFVVEPPLRPEHLAYLRAFNRTRHMKRDAAVTATLDDPVRLAAGLPVGEEGDYFVGGTPSWDKDVGEGIPDHNIPPAARPGLATLLSPRRSLSARS